MITPEEQAFLYNDGNPLTIEDIMAAAPSNCKEEVCCDNTKTGYTIESSVSTTEAQETEDACPGQAAVYFTPPSGSNVVIPFFASIFSDNEDAVIRYTTDGSAVTPLSTIYTGPIEITSLSQIIKAKAYVENCPEPPEYTAFWTALNGVQLVFSRCCATDDLAGRWDVFATNGRPDHQFRLSITNTANLDVKRFEIYQLDDDLEWTTGQMWATDSPVYPPFPWPQNIAFSCYPAVFYIGAAQQNAAYLASYGTIAAGSTQFEIYCEKEFEPSGYFKLRMILDDETVVETVIDADDCIDCSDPPPPPCFTIDKPVLVPICSGIRVDIDVPAPARDYNIYRKTCTGPDPWVLVETGNGSGAISFSDTPLTFGVMYKYYAEIRITDVGYEHCPEFVSSPPSDCADTLCPPGAVTFYADPDEIDDPGGTTFHIETSCATSATIDGPGFGGPTPVGTLNTPTTVPLAECVGDPGDLLTYTLAVTNACGTVNFTTQVQIRALPSCDPATQDSIIMLADASGNAYFNGMVTALCPACNGNGGACPAYASLCGPEPAPWDGRMRRQNLGICAWDNLCTGTNLTSAFTGAGPPGKALEGQVSFTGGVWVLILRCHEVDFFCDTTHHVIWEGRKSTGDNPYGIYTNYFSECGITVPTQYSIIPNP